MRRSDRSPIPGGLLDIRPISVVIPNREGAELLPRTLPPLLRELPPGESEDLVVDDASRDCSVELLQRDFPAVRVLALPQSVGFGVACNRGLQEAEHGLVLLLNSDMEVTPGSLEALGEHFDDPRVFAAGPAYWGDDPSKPRPSVGDPPHRPQLGSPAGGGLFRRDLYLELGGFDPLYHPFYWEDLDLGWRAWRAGWRVIYDTRVHFLHLESATIKRLYPRRFVTRIRARNRCLFGWRNLTEPGLLVRFLGRSLGRGLKALCARGDPWETLGVLESIGHVGQALRGRPAGASLRDSVILEASATTFRQLNGV